MLHSQYLTLGSFVADSFFFFFFYCPTPVSSVNCTFFFQYTNSFSILVQGNIFYIFQVFFDLKYAVHFPDPALICWNLDLRWTRTEKKEEENPSVLISCLWGRKTKCVVIPFSFLFFPVYNWRQRHKSCFTCWYLLKALWRIFC